MAFDGVFMRAMRRELLERLVGARVEKVTQPEKDEVILFLRTFDPATRHSASYRLLLSANPSFPRVHLTEEARENPQVPPNLCMLLRKHLLGARLTDIRQVGTERVLTFVFEGRTELYETTERWLILELMGRGSNLILTAGDGRIFDCLHSCDISAGSKRGLLPGLIYEMPPAQKKSYLDDAVLADDFFSGDERADRKLCALILGFSPVLAREAVFAATGGCDAVAGEFSDVQKKKLNDFLDGLRSRLATGKFEPTAVFSADGPVEFFFQPLVQYGEGFLSRRYVTCSEAAEAYFRQKASAENRRRASSDITKLLQTNIARLSRKVEAQRIELEQYGKAEEYRHYGDLLIAHLGEVKRGDEAVRVTDYLTGEPVSVRLDVRLSPTQNAQRYYKLYKKAQTAKRVLAERIAGSDGEQREHYRTVYRYAERVPEQPPRNFREALQSLMFQFAFQRQCGNWPGIGRIDVMLGEYLRKDLADGSITLDEAREYLAHFWIKGCEWIGESGVFEGTGDGQHYQNILLSGVDTDGNDVENEVTFLVLDVVEETGISDFPIAVRISRRSSERLLRRIAEVQRLGTGTVAVYNNDFIVSNLVEFGYDVREARDFANDGCWEIQIPGKTCFTYYPYDLVEILDRVLGVKGDVIPDYPTFEDLYGAYVSAMKSRANDIVRLDGIHWAASGAPNVLFSLWTQDCVERAHGYFDRGARYNVLSPHASGLPDVINSLFVLKKLVYEQKKIDYKTLISYLREDWKGHEDLRARIRKDYAGYGNDEEEADALGRRLLYDFSWFQREIKQLNGVLFPAGASTFGREIAAAEVRMAQASGHHAHEILAANMTPTPGTDKEGPTAILKSLGALDLTSLVGGTALDMKIQPSAVSGEEGIDVLVALYKTFVDVGGIFLHIDIVDNKTLRDAQLHPEKYPTLAVRVSGWSARFNTLGRNFQEMVILKSMQTRM